MSIDFIAEDQRDSEDNFDIPHQYAEHKIVWTKGAENNPSIAHRAQQIHGASYVEYGYFSADALTQDGQLVPELDGTRERPGLHLDISYLLALPRNSEDVAEANATIRLGDIAEDGSIEDLPTYKYFKEGMMADVREELERVAQGHGTEAVIREVMALASEGREGHKGAYELMRTVIQNAIIKKEAGGLGELYITALTDKSLGPVLTFAGTNASTTIGESVRIFSDDSRAASDLCVTPVLIDPHKIIDGTVQDIERCDDSTKGILLHKKLLLLVDGLTQSQMGDRATAYLRAHHAA